MIYAYILAALAVFTAGFGSAWNWQENKYEVIVAGLNADADKKELDAAKAQTTAVNKARVEEQAISKTYQDALNEARKREALALAAQARLRAESDSLRAQSADAARRLATAPPTAVLEYAAALDSVFGDCRAAYEEMVRAADGHAADARTLQASWPVKKE